MRDFAFLDTEHQFAFAHRGGDEVAPENTVAAFEHADALGYRYLETDVHRSADGVLVAFHDAALQRVAGRGGSIAELTWDELSAIDLGGGATIPTMEELLRRFDTARWNIDPKSDDAVEPLADLLARTNAVDRVCIGSFMDQRIARMQERLGPALCTSPGRRASGILWAACTSGQTVRALRSNRLVTGLARRFGCLQVPVSLRGIEVTTPGLINSAHELGLQVHVWTVNDRREMERLLDAGVDAVMTDKVSVLREVLVDRHRWPSSC